VNRTMVKCAFCHGRGIDPFGIMSPSSVCYVCGGKRQVAVEEPLETCSHCGGSGIEPSGYLTCAFCKGKGKVDMRSEK